MVVVTEVVVIFTSTRRFTETRNPESKLPLAPPPPINVGIQLGKKPLFIRVRVGKDVMSGIPSTRG